MLTGILVVLFVIVCVLLVLCILLQKGRGGGLSAAFGGAGSAFGTKTGDMFTWVTIVLTAVFLVLVLSLVWVYKDDSVAVVAPTFSPAPTGEETGPTQVTIRVQSADASLFYRIGDEDGDYTSYVKGTPITVEAGQTIYAYAEQVGFERSTTAMATYGQVDDGAEVVAPVLPEAPGATDAVEDAVDEGADAVDAPEDAAQPTGVGS